MTCRTPVPWLADVLVIACRTFEPLALTLILGYIVRLLAMAGVTHGNDEDIGFYASILEGCFMASSSVMVLMWALLSDRIGRKPVLVICVLQVSLWSVAFGATNAFWLLVVFRTLSGFINGQSAVARTMLIELADATNESIVFNVHELMWTTAEVVALPSLFGSSRFFRARPFLLPPLVSVIVPAGAALLSTCYLRETLPTSKKDYELLSKDEYAEATRSPIQDSPLWTTPVKTSLLAILWLSIKDSAFFALLPVFAGTPVELGGLGFDTLQTSAWLSGWAVAGTLTWGLWSSHAERRFTRLGVARLSNHAWLPFFALLPLLHRIRSYERSAGLATWLGVSFVTIFPLIGQFGWVNHSLILANAPSSHAQVARVNAFGDLLIKIGRLIGMSGSTAFFAASVKYQVFGGQLVYVVLCFISIIGVAIAYRIEEGEGWRAIEEDKKC